MKVGDRICISEHYNYRLVFYTNDGKYLNNISLYDFFCRYTPVIIISQYEVFSKDLYNIARNNYFETTIHVTSVICKEIKQYGFI